MPFFEQPENATTQFKCANCGLMFGISEHENICPGCGYNCDENRCQMIEASDEGY